jgi:hypothetical protein
MAKSFSFEQCMLIPFEHNASNTGAALLRPSALTCYAFTLVDHQIVPKY